MIEFHWIQMAQTKLAESEHIKTFFAAYIEKNFNIGAGAMIACNRIIEMNIAYKLNNFDDLAKFLKEEYDVRPK